MGGVARVYRVARKGRQAMTTKEVCNFIVAQAKSALLRPPDDGSISQADYALMEQWFLRRIESRITPDVCQVCERMAAGELEAKEQWRQIAGRMLGEIGLEFQEIVAASLAGFVGEEPYMDAEKFR